MYKLNENYFAKIDNANKAYWLGFIAADGYICGNKFGIELQGTDSNHLEKLKQDINTDRPLRYRERNNKKYVRLEINNQIFCNNLKQYNIIERKTYDLKFPNIPEKYYRDYIRGFFDGDGSYSYYVKNEFRKDRNKYYDRKHCEINCVCKCVSFLSKILDILNNNNVKVKLGFCKRDTLYTLRIYGVKNSQDFIKYIYYNDCLMLDRKLNKIKEINIA